MRTSILKNLSSIVLFVFALCPMLSAQSELVGEWQGGLSAGGQDFRIVWHVIKADDGTVTSTFDNVDQGAFGIKVKSMEQKGSNLTLTIDDVMQAGGQEVHVSGSFAGTVSKDGNVVTGVWTQVEPQPGPADLILKRIPPAPATPPTPAAPAVPPTQAAPPVPPA